jgi:hypothetical protein
MFQVIEFVVDLLLLVVIIQAFPELRTPFDDLLGHLVNPDPLMAVMGSDKRYWSYRHLPQLMD